MGLLTDALRLVIPENKTAIGATTPTWQAGNPQYELSSIPYVRAGREGYGGCEIVYACIEELATSAAEPRMAAYTGKGKNREQIEEHPILDLLERPNPFMDRYTFWAAVILYLSIAGNAYIEKVRSKADGVVQLWLLRPDRVRVIPDRDRFVAGYHYELGDIKHDFDARDIIHIKYRHPVDDYYGLPPLAVIAPRVDTDTWMRSFARSFFLNAGVPSGLLTVERTVGAAERELMKQRFRGDTGGPGGWHSTLVLDNTAANYTPMGLPIGARGLAMPELDEISEARLAMVFGVPLELIGARLSMRGQRSAAREARAGFWDETLCPLYAMLAAPLNTGLVPEFADIDSVEFDLSTVKALEEDTDAKHKRLRDDMLSGGITREEFRKGIGLDEEPKLKDTWVLGPRITEVAVDAPPPEPVAPSPSALASPASTVTGPAGAEAAATVAANGSKLGRPLYITREDVHRAKAWVAALDAPVLDEALNGGTRNGHRS